jgi:hypothetical protein
MQSTPQVAQQDPVAQEVKYVTKRDGSKQTIDKTKIKMRLSELTEGLNSEFLNLDVVIEKVYQGTYPGKQRIFLTL